MEHAETLELLELASVEPDGLDRIMAGDTPEAVAVAGHLAGCEACSRELVRLQRADAILRASIGRRPPMTPSPFLRERTLALVLELGRERSAEGGGVAVSERAGGAESPDVASPGGESARPAVPDRGAVRPISRPPEAPTPGPAEPAPRPGPVPAHVAAAGSRSGVGRLGRWAAIAAAIVFAAAGTGFAVNSISADRQARLDRTVEDLAELTTGSLRIGTSPDAEHVQLASTSGQGAGLLLFSRSSRELVVVMTGFGEPPAGREYRCWVRIGDRQVRVGRMFFGGALGYWVGPVSELAEVGPGAVFGVTLVDVSNDKPIGEPALLGTFSA